jgi:hypothetical protein
LVDPGCFRHDQWPWRSADKTLRVSLEAADKVSLRACVTASTSPASTIAGVISPTPL